MKAENIKKFNNGNVSCTLNGIILTGTLEQVNKILFANSCEVIKFEPEHWSETKQEWIPISSMAAKHIENYLLKERDIDDYFIEKLKDNYNNFRDYLKRLITIYDNYNNK